MSQSKTRYHDLTEPRKRASNTELGKAFARSSDYLYTQITQDLTDETTNPPEEIYVNRLVLLGVNVFGAALLEHLPKHVIGRTPRPDIALQDFWDELAMLKKAFYDAFDKEVEARIAERTPDEQQQKALEQLAAYDQLMKPLDQPEAVSTEKEVTPMLKPKHPRVHEVAKELGMNSKQLLSVLQDLGYIDFTSHMNVITDAALLEQLPTLVKQDAPAAPQQPTVATVAKDLGVTTAQLIATLAEIDHVDLNHPDAHVYDSEIVDHVREVLNERKIAA